MPRNSARAPLKVPIGYPTSVIYIDESGSKATASQFFVIGAVKLRHPGAFARTLLDVRERTGFNRGEFKFSEITQGSLPFYYEVIDELQKSDATLAACVVDRAVHNPFKGARPVWRVHAEITAQLLVGCINRNELVTVLLDGLSTPRGCALDDTVRDMVNRRFKATSVVGATCLDSRTCDGLQVADLVASAIGFERRVNSGKPSSPKGKVAARLKAAFAVSDFVDQRSARVNIATYKTSPKNALPLRVVRNNSAS